MIVIRFKSVNELLELKIYIIFRLKLNSVNNIFNRFIVISYLNRRQQLN